MKKVLVVEDDIDLLRLYKEILVNAGFETETAEDGREALEKAETFLPDLMLLDLMLPYIDGFEVLRQLKAKPVTKDIKIVVFTNLDSEKQKEKALSLGATKFMVKVGNDPSEVITAVKSILLS